MKNIDIQSILEQEITRKQFLKQIGIALVAVVGIPSFIKGIDSAFQPQVQQTKNLMAYGESAYSGTHAVASTEPGRRIG